MCRRQTRALPVRDPAGLSASPPPRHTGPGIKIKINGNVRRALVVAVVVAVAVASASPRRSACSLVGPLRRGEAGTIGPQGRAQEVRAFVVSTWVCCRQTPAPTHEPFGQGCPKGAAPGWPFSWLLLFGHSKRSDSGARRRTKKAMDGARVTARAQKSRSRWIPACAGMTSEEARRPAVTPPPSQTTPASPQPLAKTPPPPTTTHPLAANPKRVSRCFH